MKAILKNNRKVIVDVDFCWNKFSIKNGNIIHFRKDSKTDKVYNEDELDFIEYYGG